VHYVFHKSRNFLTTLYIKKQFVDMYNFSIFVITYQIRRSKRSNLLLFHYRWWQKHFWNRIGYECREKKINKKTFK
jgi:hypothetical protein